MTPGTVLPPLPGIAIGHWHDPQGITGCTVLLPRAGAMRASVSVRGGAPGTRETDLLAPGATVPEIHALLLTGGSAFGLDAASGVMTYLRERGRGFDAGVARVPIVPAAVIFDLDSGSAGAYPDAAAGYAACAAAADDEAREGSVGAGYGACVGRLLGPAGRTKGGLGLATETLEGGVRVGALAVVNAVGDVLDAQGRILAGTRLPQPLAGPSAAPADGTGLSPAPAGDADLSPARSTGASVQHSSVADASTQDAAAAVPRRPSMQSQGPFAGSAELMRRGAGRGQPLVNTTLVAVATDAQLDKTALWQLAQRGHDGLARALSPVHTAYDGDTVFALSTGDAVGGAVASLDALSVLAVDLITTAIRRAVAAATAVASVPAIRDLQRGMEPA